tara:strand:+ start:2760 stop:3305 length:546 start_codon:yes stop_codon:yes gene_type:complete
MFNNIVNPETGRYVKTSGKTGQQVLRNYLRQNGGDSRGGLNNNNPLIMFLKNSNQYEYQVLKYVSEYFWNQLNLNEKKNVITQWEEWEEISVEKKEELQKLLNQLVKEFNNLLDEINYLKESDDQSSIEGINMLEKLQKLIDYKSSQIELLLKYPDQYETYRSNDDSIKVVRSIPAGQALI